MYLLPLFADKSLPGVGRIKRQVLSGRGRQVERADSRRPFFEALPAASCQAWADGGGDLPLSEVVSFDYLRGLCTVIAKPRLCV